MNTYNNGETSTADPHEHTIEDVGVEYKAKTEPPKLFRVILHNDDVTPFEFVVLLLMQVFRKADDEAIEITMEVHEGGQGIAGVFTHEMAEQKHDEANALIATWGMQLKITIEEDS